MPLRTRVASSLLLVAIAAASPARAQSAPELARARSDFHEALALETAGDWAGALTKLRAVAAVKMTAQVRFNIAVCEEKLGRLVAALGDFELAASEAEEAGADDVRAKADDHLERLTDRIPKLVIVRGPGASTAAISLDGVALGSAAIGQPMNVDPGSHAVVATVGGTSRFEVEVDLSETETRRIEVKIAPLPGARRAERAELPPDEPVGPAAVSHGDAWVWLGAGGGALVVSGVFWGLRAGTVSDLDGQCVDGRCPASASATADRGKLYTGFAEVTLLGGLGAAGYGAYLYFTAKPATRPGALAVVTSAPGAPLGATLVGAF